MFRGSNYPLLLGLLSLMGAAVACGNNSKENMKGTNTVQPNPNNAAAGLQTDAIAAGTETGVSSNPKGQVIDPEYIKQHYPEIYCEHVVQLDLRVDVSEDLSYFCPDGKPSPEMLSMRERLMNSPNGRTVLQIVSSKVENELSQFTLAWGYRVPVRPFEVKANPLYAFIAKDYENDGVVMHGTASRRPDAELDSGLHLWSVDMAYDLIVKATTGIDLSSSRKTQYNLYQVESGSEEMGFGVESLNDPEGTDFVKSTMLNLAFNDGGGFNDGKGTAIVLNLLTISLKNKGFPETAEHAIGKLGQFLADSMYEGLTQNITK